MAILA